MQNEHEDQPTPEPELDASAEDSPDAPAQEKLLTQSEVGKIIAREREKAREQALKELRQTQSQPKTDKGRVLNVELQSQIDALKLQVGFEKAIRQYGLNEDQVGALQDLATVAKPEDLNEWLSGTVKRLGLSSTANSTPPTKTQPSSPTLMTPPASDRGGPAPTSDGLAQDNPLRWTQSDVDRIVGGQDSYQKGIQEVKKRFMAGLRGVTIEFPRGPR